MQMSSQAQHGSNKSLILTQSNADICFPLNQFKPQLAVMMQTITWLLRN